MLRKVASASFMMIAVVVVFGCGSGVERPPLGKVTGKVTFNGQPVKSGSVAFNPAKGPGAETGQIATGQLESDGTFTLTTFDTGDGAVIGQHVVTVTARSEDSNFGKKKADGTFDYVLPKSSIPEKYSDATKSNLLYTVEANKNNHFEIELK